MRTCVPQQLTIWIVADRNVADRRPLRLSSGKARLFHGVTSVQGSTLSRCSSEQRERFYIFARRYFEFRRNAAAACSELRLRRAIAAPSFGSRKYRTCGCHDKSQW
jgi:hypothetical protein